MSLTVNMMLHGLSVKSYEEISIPLSWYIFNANQKLKT